MIINLALSFLVSFLLGYLYILAFFQNDFLNRIKFLRLFLSLAVGFGISSILFFIWMIVTGSGANFKLFELICLLGLFIIAFIKNKNNKQKTSKFIPWNFSYWPAWAGLILLMVINFLSIFIYTLVNPYGEEDNIHLWAGKAVFFFRAENHRWLDLFNDTDKGFHPDYPLFLPNLIAKTWSYTDIETYIVPILIAIVFLIATVFILTSSISYFKGEKSGLLSGAILLGSPLFILTAIRQTADVPLGFLMLACLIVLFIERKTKNNRLLMLAGLLAGLCAWLKNEGILFFILVFIFRFKDSLKLLIGSLPVLLALVYFKSQIVFSNDIFALQGGFSETLTRLFDLSRYLTTAGYFVELVIFKLVGIFLFILLASYLLLSEVKLEQGLLLISMIFAGMVVGYFLVYIITPHDLVTHLETSLRRILVQLYPSFLFIYFMLVKSKEAPR